MFTGLLHIHSLFRWLILLLLLAAIIKAFAGWFGKKSFSSLDNKLSLFTMIAAHIQLATGLILYLLSPVVKNGFTDFIMAMKDGSLRFWTIEHILGMIIGITLITLGRIKLKKNHDDVLKHKKIAIYFLIALVIIFISIPWPWSKVPRGFYVEHVISHF